MSAVPVTTKKDWSSDRGSLVPRLRGLSILTAMQLLMPELEVRRRTTCSSPVSGAARFPYYMNTYGMD